MIDYNSQLNREVVQLKPSGIRRFFDIANEMDEVISLSIGEPDFSTPWHVRQEGIHSLEEGKTWYSPNRGFLELRDEISKWFDRHYGVTYDSKTQVLVTVGESGGGSADPGAEFCVLCPADRDGGRETGDH